MSNLLLCKLYKELKKHALCLDVEYAYFNGPISVIGLYKPAEGEIIYDSFVRGKNLNFENLKMAFSGCKLLITYNGFILDIPRIQNEFPGVLPKDVKVMDLYLMAKDLGLDTNLKVLETTLGIDRLHEFTKKRHIATKLWRKYEKNKNEKALNDLLEYNKQDTINLYPIAEKLVEMVLKKINQL
jgi:uncharacterized protein YprB with RNaseH-like and TPR domain